MQYSGQNFPQNFPQKMIGKFTYKIVQKKDHVRKDGTSALYVQIFLNGQRKRLPLHIFIEQKKFDSKKQRVRGNTQIANDLNLIINKKLADINSIAVNYRLNSEILTMPRLLNDLENPSLKLDFLKFYEYHLELENKRGFLKKGTYRQQKSTLTKLKKFKKHIFFHEITEDFIKELKSYLKVKLKNKEVTVHSTLKNFKKYLHIANKEGIKTQLRYDDIKVKSFEGKRTFLLPEEIKRLNEYLNSEFCTETHKNVLRRFLFSCFTGLRISDIIGISQKNFLGKYLIFSSEKTGKLQQFKLSKNARKFISKKGNDVFEGEVTPEHINRELKKIANICKIKKRLTFHVARHTFATNFIMQGGDVVVLQQYLGHSNIRETMIYVHIAKSYTDKEIMKLDEIKL